jgi:hypothetical protein
MNLAKEAEVCTFCGALVVNVDMHTAYHQYLQDTIALMNEMLNIVWDDAKLDKSKKVDPLPAPPVIDY